MLKKAILLAIIATFSSYANAQSMNNLNSALSVTDINHEITDKFSSIPYAGKDLAASHINNLNTAAKIIC